MDISKASNFERFVFDLLGRDAERVRELFAGELVRTGRFDLSGTPEFAQAQQRFGIVSAASSHADRVAAIQRVQRRWGVTIDPHTADGVTVAGAYAGAEPVVVCETALPVKFSATIVEALGREPERPARFEGLESLPRHVVDLHGGAAELKRIIAG
jgi:threonine synthase